MTAPGRTALSGAEALFPACPVPGCPNLVSDPRQVCGECLATFGPYLRPADAEAPPAEQYAAQIAARDEHVAAVLAERAANTAGEWKRNQVCWCCEERRTCRQDRDTRNGWICRPCLEIQ